jgi:hypothetical protein
MAAPFFKQTFTPAAATAAAAVKGSHGKGKP